MSKDKKDVSFRLFGTTWTITYPDAVKSKGKDKHWIFGNNSLADRIIRISKKNSKGEPLDKETIATTALHELVHAILTSGQYLQETQNESLVEWIARSIQSLYEQGILQDILDNNE